MTHHSLTSIHNSNTDSLRIDCLNYNDDSQSNDFVRKLRYYSEEDTEEASETEMPQFEEPMEIKEQMYQDKLANLQKQLKDLKEGKHPDYIKTVKILEHQFKERIRLNEVHRDYLKECVEKDTILEKKAAAKEYEEKKADLKESLISNLENKRKTIESEGQNIELTSDSIEIKPTVTRKLRRRPNEPVPMIEKRRKGAAVPLVAYMLDEKDIENDLKIINRASIIPSSSTNENGIFANSNKNISTTGHNLSLNLVDTRIEDGKLLFERRWFHRGQPVYVEGNEMTRFAANISAIGNEIVWVKKISDNNKVKVSLQQLASGNVIIKRRAY